MRNSGTIATALVGRGGSREQTSGPGRGGLPGTGSFVQSRHATKPRERRGGPPAGNHFSETSHGHSGRALGGVATTLGRSPEAHRVVMISDGAPLPSGEVVRHSAATLVLPAVTVALVSCQAAEGEVACRAESAKPVPPESLGLVLLVVSALVCGLMEQAVISSGYLVPVWQNVAPVLTWSRGPLVGLSRQHFGVRWSSRRRLSEDFSGAGQYR